MDPVTHTLVGATLAQTRLGRLSALAAPTLILGANAPDIDAIAMLIDRDFSLGFRRGWTHGALALAVLPLLLTGLICLLDRAAARWRKRAPRARPGRLLLLAYIAVASHPALDWLNTYGVRLLMPFDGRWFYGDALFILDPLVWLLAGAAVVAAHSRTAAAVAGWLALGLAMTLLLALIGSAPAAVWTVWLAGLAGIALARARNLPPLGIRRLAAVALAVMAAYMLAMAGGSRLAARQATEWLAARGRQAEQIMAGPLPARPLARDIVVVDADHYHFLELDWLRADPIRVSDPPLPRGDGPIAAAALTAPYAQGIRTWLRFPLYTVEELPDGYRVAIQDVRYARRQGPAFPNVVVELDRNLQPRPLGR